MRAPNKSRLDEVVLEIVTKLHGKATGEDDLDFAAAKFDVHGTVQLLRELDRKVSGRGGAKGRTPIRGNRQENIEDFNVLLKQIESLQKTLRKASGPALAMLFSGENDVTSDEVPPVETQKRIERRVRQTTGMLAYLRARCNFLLEQRPGEHGSADYRQRRVAHEAWQLLKRSGKTPAGGTMDSLYGRITSLLYEAVTGEGNKDLQWACKAALRLAEEGGLRDNGSIIGHGQIPLS